MQSTAREMVILEPFSWLIQDKLDRRRSCLLERRNSMSGETRPQDIRAFDRGYITAIPEREIPDLIAHKFISAMEVILFVSAPDTGKSPAAKALGTLPSPVDTRRTPGKLTSS
jgi:hypothetical protein